MNEEVTLLEGKVAPKYNKPKMTAVPLPKDLFYEIVVDEITRTFYGKVYKAVVAVENVSKYMYKVEFEINRNEKEEDYL